MKSRLIVFILAACCLACGCLCVSWMFPKRTSRLERGEGEMDRYVNPVFGYSLPVPHGWLRSENMTPAPSYVVFAPSGDESEARIIISTLDEPRTLAEQQAFLKQQPAELEIIAAEEAVVEGTEAFRLDHVWSGTIRYGIFAMESPEGKLRAASLHILREGAPVIVVCISDAAGFIAVHDRYFRHTLSGVQLFARKTTNRR